MEVHLDDVADRLYALAPEEFTAARDAAAREAADGDLRKAVKALRRPTASAHAVNVLVRERGDDVAALVALGDEMRAAMGGDAAEVRRLAEERRNRIADLVDADLPTPVQQDVTATLEAATADPGLGAAVRTGRLVKPLRYAGFGAMPDLDDVVATPVRAPKKAARDVSTKQAPKKAAAKKAPARKARKAADDEPDLAAARQHCLDLAGAADDAQRRYEQAARAATEARALLDRAEKERAEAHREARAAHQAAEKARRDLGRLERS